MQYDGVLPLIGFFAFILATPPIVVGIITYFFLSWWGALATAIGTGILEAIYLKLDLPLPW